MVGKRRKEPKLRKTPVKKKVTKKKVTKKKVAKKKVTKKVPAKRKAPPKPRGHKVVSPTPAPSIETVIRVELPHEQSMQRDSLRMFAGHYYVSNLRGASLDDMTKMPQFGGADKRTLERWSAEDKWTSKRAAFMEAAESQIRSALMSEVVTIKRQQLSTLQELFDLAVAKLKPTVNEDGVITALPPEPKSFESLLNAVFRAHSVLDSARTNMIGVFAPEVYAQSGEGESIAAPTIQVQPKLTMAESRAAAHTLITMRMAQQGVTVDEPESDEEDEDDHAYESSLGV